VPHLKFAKEKRGRRLYERISGPLPPALLTNAFANPFEVCAAGAIIMTPSRPFLQRLSLCCAKMSLSFLDDGGEVMAIAIGAQVLPAAVKSQPRATKALLFVGVRNLGRGQRLKDRYPRG
jgi:hypothetical protein